MYPDLGKAGTPYARTVRSETMKPGARPDPGLLFDRALPNPIILNPHRLLKF